MAGSTYFADEIIAELLRYEKIGVDPERHDSKYHWPVYAGQMGSEPDDAIGINCIGIPTDGRIMKTGETQGLQGFSVRVRSKKQRTVVQKCADIQLLFDSVLDYELSVQETRYRVHAIHQLIQPVFIGADPNNRVSYTINCITKFYKLTP